MSHAEARPVILVVDDEPEIASFLESNLLEDDFEVHVAASAAHARSKLAAIAPDVILLDVGLPDGNGFDLCRELRAQDPIRVRFDPLVPVIMLTARSEAVDRVRGFERGADDFVTKPFHYPEVLARIRAVLRRARSSERDVLTASGIVLDMRTREVRVNEVEVRLSGKEFQLLAVLAGEPKRVFRKQELLELVWGFRSMGSTRTLDSHASRLRRKLRPMGNGQAYIGNVWGVGYRLLGAEDCP